MGARLLVVGVLSLLAGACAPDARLCVPGDLEQCRCGDGSYGYRTCQQGGASYGGCDCVFGLSPEAGVAPGMSMCGRGSGSRARDAGGP